MKDKFNKLKMNFKKFFGKKSNLITTIIIVIIVAIVLVVAILNKDTIKKKFALNSIYDVYPEDVKKLYSNMVSVSCYGDLHFNIELDYGDVSVTNLDKNNLLDYLFSNLDKDNLLTDKMTLALINGTSNKLYADDIRLSDYINNYQYGEYVYNVENGKIVRKKKDCESDKNYVSNLSGYSYNIDELSVDVNVGYLKDGILYDLKDNRLGEYDGDAAKLRDLFQPSANYKLIYVMRNKQYKLKSISWNSKI